jgi:GGDEF domain-containing protein
MWYFQMHNRGVYPPINAHHGPDAFARVWQELFRLVGRDCEPPNFLAHPGGNAFAIPIADIHEKNQVRSMARFCLFSDG